MDAREGSNTLSSAGWRDQYRVTTFKCQPQNIIPLCRSRENKHPLRSVFSNERPKIFEVVVYEVGIGFSPGSLAMSHLGILGGISVPLARDPEIVLYAGIHVGDGLHAREQSWRGTYIVGRKSISAE